MDNLDRPDWRPDYWQYLQGLWGRVSDCYHGLHTPELKRKYLRQQLGEHDKIYQARIETVAFENRLSPSVKSHAGLLSDYRLGEDTPVAIREALDDVDGQGNSLESVLLDWDVDGLLYNATLALVDVPPREDTRDEGRPRIVPLRLRDVYAPLVELVDGALQITRVAIRRSISVQAGLFGTQDVDRFWVYRLIPSEGDLRRADGRAQSRVAVFEVWQVDPEDANKFDVLEPAKPLLDAAGRPLDRIPLVWYSPYGDPVLFNGVDNMTDRGGTPEYLSLVDLNFEYFNKHSELNTAESRGNFVIMMMRFPGAAPKVIPDLIAGHRLAVMEGGSDLGLLEPQGTALASTREGQNSRLQRMDAIAQSFLTGGDVAMTATQAVIESSQSRLGLRNIARRKESAVQQLFEWWERFSNPDWIQDDPVGGITVSEAILTVPPSYQDLQFWQSEYLNGSLSREPYHEKQRELGVFSDAMAELEGADTGLGLTSGLGLSATPQPAPVAPETPVEDTIDGE